MRILNALSIMVFLTSCTREVLPTQPPLPDRPLRYLGSVELSFNTALNQAELRPVPRASVADVSLGFVRLAFTDFVASGVRYLYATFKVTNLTTQPLSNLSFHAYSQAGQSVGGTALKNIVNFSDMALTDPAFAQRLKPTHAVEQVGSLVKVKEELADFQGFTPQETIVAQNGAEGVGSVSNADQVLEYGFVVRKPTSSVPVRFSREIGAGSGPERCTTPVQLGLACNEGTVTLAYQLPSTPLSDINRPYRFTATFTVSESAVVRVTRGLFPQDSSTQAIARAVSLSAQEVLLIGPADAVMTPLFAGTITTVDNLKISTSGTLLLEPTP